MVRAAQYILSLLLLFPLSSQAEILFEGYAKILSGEEAIGYVINRYEFDEKKKEFLSTYFVKTGKGASEVTESLRARATSELVPISYEYTSLAGKETRTIDAKFKAGNMSAVVREGGKTQRIEKKIPKGTFLSTFLVYLMLKSNEGLKAETNYEYQAIAEEDAAIHKGQALTGKEELYRGFKVYKILNTFKDSKFLSYVNARGEVLGTHSLGQGITTQLVALPSDATAGQSYSTALLKTLFGNIPEGQKNVVAESAKTAAPAPLPKQHMVPPGQGIIIKAQPQPTPDTQGRQ